MKEWTTGLPDWERRIVAGESLIPCAPLFPAEAQAALDVIDQFIMVDVAGSPTFGAAARPWVRDFVASIFGAYDPESGRRLIREWFLLISKKNGKALALDTPIPTPAGWSTMGALQVGDVVFGATGNRTRVTATSEVFTDHKCYRLKFSNGETVVADAGHLWLTTALLDEPGSGQGNKGANRGRRRTRVRTTQEIVDTLFRPGDGARNHSIAMPEAIDGTAVELPVARSRTVQIVGAEEIAPVPVKCITVDAPDKMFLFGRSLLPTHNSTDAGLIMLTFLILNWRTAGEFGILAPTVEVADNAYKPAADAIKADDELKALFHVQDHIRTITHLGTKATLKVVAADSETVSGKKWIVTLVDELWLFGKRPKAADMLREATGGLLSRPEGCTIWLSTQSNEPPAGVFKQKLDYARGVRDGRIKDNKFCPVLYEFPRPMVATQAYRKPENFYITNPNFGASVDEETLLREWAKAEEVGEDEVRGFLAKHLNVEIGMALGTDRWAGAEFWEACHDPTLNFETLLQRCEVIVAGIDGGGLDDLLGLSLVGRERGTGNWLHWAHAWAHEIALVRRKEIAPRLLDFQKAGDLTIVKMPGDDVRELADYLCRVRDLQLFPEKQCLGVDAAGIGDIVDELTNPQRKFTLEEIVAISQGWKLNGAIKTTERAVAGKSLLHCGQPLMAWCIGNARTVQVGNAVTINKQVSGSAKIDPLMATFDAVTLIALNPKARQRKYQMLFVGGPGSQSAAART